jgi:DUF4097 and DUF4098 domain-containing protein YvlB
MLIRETKKIGIRRAMLGLLACLSLLTLAASGARTQTEEQLREEFHQSYPLSADGRVSLENINGSVQITAWDRNEVKVDAVKRAYTRERLDEAKINVAANATSIYIKTEYPDRNQTFTNDNYGRRNNPASVEYTLTVPRGARLDTIELINGGLDISGVGGNVKASSINGRVTARGLMGEARLSTINGRLEAVFDRLDASNPIMLNSVNGGVTLTIPSDSNAELKATTVHGGISNDFGLPVRRGKYVGRDLSGRLGQGGTRVKLDNVNGSITINHAADGRPLSPATNLLPEKSEESGETDAEIERERTEAREAVRAASRDVQRAQIEIQRETARAAREALREHDTVVSEAQRHAGRDAQRETARAAREAAREVQRARVETRSAAREVYRTQNSTVFVYNGNMPIVNRETKTFAVSGSPRVTVQTFDGPVVVHAWDKPEVTINAISRARDDQQKQGIRLRMDQRGAEVSIIAEFDKAFAQQITPGVTNVQANVSLEVYVPRSSSLHAVSGDGRIIIEGVSGEVDLRTGDGPIDVQNGRGRLNATTGDGRIRIIGFDGQVETRTGDGSISLVGRFDQLSARTGDGSISLALPAGANATVETDAESVINDIGAVEEQPASQRLRRWKIGGGGNVFRLHTGDGRIVLRRSGDEQ